MGSWVCSLGGGRRCSDGLSSVANNDERLPKISELSNKQEDYFELYEKIVQLKLRVVLVVRLPGGWRRLNEKRAGRTGYKM